ncbi:MAG: right-handed parallel beta-helix repeat-containing protein [Candidatus Muiribacteriaceae bacterium]
MKRFYFLYFILIFFLILSSEQVTVTSFGELEDAISNPEITDIYVPGGSTIPIRLEVFNITRDVRIFSDKDNPTFFEMRKRYKPLMIINDKVNNWREDFYDIIFENIVFSYRKFLSDMYKSYALMTDNVFRNVRFETDCHQKAIIIEGSNLYMYNSHIITNEGIDLLDCVDREAVFENVTFETTESGIITIGGKIDIRVKDCTFMINSALPAIVVHNPIDDGYRLEIDRNTIENFRDNNKGVLFDNADRYVKIKKGEPEYAQIVADFWQEFDKYQRYFYVPYEYKEKAVELGFDYSGFSAFAEKTYNDELKGKTDKKAFRSLRGVQFLMTALPVMNIAEYKDNDDRFKILNEVYIAEKVFTENERFQMLFFPYINTFFKYSTGSAYALTTITPYIYIDGLNLENVMIDMSEEKIKRTLLVHHERYSEWKGYVEDIKGMFTDRLVANIKMIAGKDKSYADKYEKSQKHLEKLFEYSDKLSRVYAYDLPYSLVFMKTWAELNRNENNKDKLKEIARFFSQYNNEIKDRCVLSTSDHIRKTIIARFKYLFDK